MALSSIQGQQLMINLGEGGVKTAVVWSETPMPRMIGQTAQQEKSL